MATTKFLLINGSYVQEDERLFSLTNRALTHGDCLMETIRTCGERLCFFDEHMEHLRKGMAMAMMQVPNKFLNRNQEFYEEVSKLLSRNRTFHSANITIMVFRSASPASSLPDKVEYLVTEDAVNYLGYEINKDGLKIDVFEDFAMPASPLSPYWTHDNGLIRAMIRKQCLARRVNDMITTSPEGHLTESSIGGNIFLIKGDTLYTPPISDGCKDDVFRRNVLEAAREIGLIVEQDGHITKDDLQTCNEIFIGSTIYGIKWISAYRNRRFIKSKSQLIHNKINEIYQAERTDDTDLLPIQ